MRHRHVTVGFALTAAIALLTETVLLLGYTAAAASLLTIVMLLAIRAVRGRSARPIASPVPRWTAEPDREAA